MGELSALLANAAAVAAALAAAAAAATADDADADRLEIWRESLLLLLLLPRRVDWIRRWRSCGSTDTGVVACDRGSLPPPTEGERER